MREPVIAAILMFFLGLGILKDIKVVGELNV